MVTAVRPDLDTVRDWLADGTLPGWIGRLLEALSEPYQVDETAERELGLTLSTFHAPDYALGTASSSFHGQANVCMAHYRRPGADRPGVFYTSYILDDKWFGQFL